MKKTCEKDTLNAIPMRIGTDITGMHSHMFAAKSELKKNNKRKTNN